MAFRPVNHDYSVIPSYMNTSNIGDQYLNFGGSTQPAPVASPSVTPASLSFGGGSVSPASPARYSAPMGPAISTSGSPLSVSSRPVANPVNVAEASDSTGNGILSGLKKTFWGEDGLNMDNINGLFEGIGALGGLVASFKQLGLAKDALNFSKKSWETNLKNQTKSYNTAIDDRAASRAAYYNDPGYATRYSEKNRL